MMNSWRVASRNEVDCGNQGTTVYITLTHHIHRQKAPDGLDVYRKSTQTDRALDDTKSRDHGSPIGSTVSITSCRMVWIRFKRSGELHSTDYSTIIARLQCAYGTKTKPTKEAMSMVATWPSIVTWMIPFLSSRVTCEPPKSSPRFRSPAPSCSSSCSSSASK